MLSIVVLFFLLAPKEKNDNESIAIVVFLSPSSSYSVLEKDDDGDDNTYVLSSLSFDFAPFVPTQKNIVQFLIPNLLFLWMLTTLSLHHKIWKNKIKRL